MKRRQDTQLTKDDFESGKLDNNDESADLLNDQRGTEEQIAKRKIVRVRKKKNAPSAAPESAAAAAATAIAPTETPESSPSTAPAEKKDDTTPVPAPPTKTIAATETESTTTKEVKPLEVGTFTWASAATPVSKDTEKETEKESKNPSEPEDKKGVESENAKEKKEGDGNAKESEEKKEFSFDFSFNPPDLSKSSFTSPDESTKGTSTFAWSSWVGEESTSFATLSNEKEDQDGKATTTTTTTLTWDTSYTPETPTSEMNLKLDLPEEPVKTGEEEDTVILSKRVKLFQLMKNVEEEEKDEKKEETPEETSKAATPEWRERGVGTLRLNKMPDGKYRLIMRTEHTYRLAMNALLFPDMKCKKINDKALVVNVLDEEAKPVSFLVKTQKAEVTKELMEAIDKHKG